jgi:RNA recognition motif-containing protein
VPSRSSTVYVANLPWRTTEDGLAPLFQGLGQVLDVRVIQDPATGRSRGYGFVELASAEEAARAVENLNGVELGGRPLVVGFARPRPPRY